MPPCKEDGAMTASGATDAASSVSSIEKSPTTTTKTSSSSSTKKSITNDDQEQLQRPFPWNTFSDSMYMAMGIVILICIIIPTMSVIVLANLIGYGLQWTLYEYNPYGKWVLTKLRLTQRAFFGWIASYIMLDPRDSSYLPWMVWGCVVQPILFYWAYQRFLANGNKLDVATFLVYHLLRVGPRHQCFAHHATLVHKEGHASKQGLFRNLFSFSKNKKPLSKPLRRMVFDHVNAGIAGVLYGTIPNHYATAHNKIHHRWHNDTGDVHTNMDFDRTELSSYIMYLPRFVAYWTGLSPALLFYSRKEYKLLTGLLWGMAYYYTIGFVVWWNMGSVFYWAYMLYPLLEAASFLGLIAYLWHMFSDPADPTNQYVNSITILRGYNNVWEEDYHVVHHHEPYLHWTSYPKSFENHLDDYVKCRATVFGDTEQGHLIHIIFSKDWDTLTDYFVDLQYKFASGELNSTKRLTCRDVAQFERDYAQQVMMEADNKTQNKKPFKTEEDIQNHHDEIKEMLLRRLHYHYMGTRKGKWRQFNAKLNANVRDFDDDGEEEKKEA